MTRVSFIFIFLMECAKFFAQTNSSEKTMPKKELAGHYEFSRQEIKGAKAYSNVTIDIKSDMSYKYHSSSHILGGYTDESGSWNVSFDTLVLTNKEDKSIDKYLISKNKICSIPDPLNKGEFCLIKKKKK